MQGLNLEPLSAALDRLMMPAPSTTQTPACEHVWLWARCGHGCRGHALQHMLTEVEEGMVSGIRWEQGGGSLAAGQALPACTMDQILTALHLRIMGQA